MKLLLIMFASVLLSATASADVTTLNVDTSLITCTDSIPNGSRSGSNVPGHLAYVDEESDLTYYYSKADLNCADFTELRSSGVVEVELNVTVRQYASHERRNWGHEVKRTTSAFNIGEVTFKYKGPEVLLD